MSEPPSLTPPPIAQYSFAIDAGEVEAPNASSAVWTSTLDGRRWVRKGSPTTQRVTMTECICWVLAKALEVEIPEGAVLVRGDERIWMSELVRSAPWIAGAALRVRNPEVFGRMLFLDVLVDNADRHHRNVLLSPADEEGGLTLWAVDLDAAGVGGFAAWDGVDNVEPAAPRAIPSPPFWLAEVEWSALEGDFLWASERMTGFLRNHVAWLHSAMAKARGSDPPDDELDFLVRYLAWRSTSARSMGHAYWSRAHAE